MFFLINENKKILFGWSAKCGCSHVKYMWLYLNDINFTQNDTVHKNNTYNNLPKNIDEYTVVIFIRNPYKRIVSGFLDKYKEGGEFRYRWKNSLITFNDFIDELISNNYSIINKHHFTPQTSEAYNSNIKYAKNLKLYDICNIDYNYIGHLFDKTIPNNVKNFKGTHTRNNLLQSSKFTDVWNLNMSTYINYNIENKYFYNKDIQNKVYNFYKSDFNWFREYGIEYDI